MLTGFTRAAVMCKYSKLSLTCSQMHAVLCIKQYTAAPAHTLRNVFLTHCLVLLSFLNLSGQDVCVCRLIELFLENWGTSRIYLKYKAYCCHCSCLCATAPPAHISHFSTNALTLSGKSPLKLISNPHVYVPITLQNAGEAIPLQQMRLFSFLRSFSI